MKRFVQFTMLGSLLALAIGLSTIQVHTATQRKTHDPAKPDMVVDLKSASATKGSTMRPLLSAQAQIGSVTTLTDKQKLQMFASAHVNVTPIMGIITKAVLTPRVPAIQHQAWFYADLLNSFYPGDSEESQTPRIHMKEKEGDFTIDFLPFQGGQPTLITVNIGATNNTALRMLAGSLDQDVQLSSGSQTLSCVITPPDTNPSGMTLITLPDSSDWYFYSAEISVLK